MVLLLHKKPVGSTFNERATRGEGALTYHSDKSIPGCSKFFPAWAAGALVVKGSTVRIGPFELPCEAKDRALLEGSDLHGASMYSVQYPPYACEVYDLRGQQRGSTRSQTAHGIRPPAAAPPAGDLKRFDAMTTYQAEFLHAACTTPLQGSILTQQHHHGTLASPARAATTRHAGPRLALGYATTYSCAFDEL